MNEIPPMPLLSEAEGWVRLIGSGELQAGEVASATVAGAAGDLDVVVWRTADGSPCVMDARCPHMHSHLGAEGSIDGNEIICCTHWWRFAADGTGTYENANGEREARSPITIYPCRETDTEVQVQLS